MTDEIRVVLLKPGDVLLIGNLPSAEDLARATEQARNPESAA